MKGYHKLLLNIGLEEGGMSPFLCGFEEEAGFVAPAELAVGLDAYGIAFEHGGEGLGV